MHPKAKEKKQLNIIFPMLATLSKEVFSDKEWLFERKFDGIRVLVLKKNHVVSLYSRNKNNINKSYPELVKAFEDLKQDNFLIDGELVALNKGVTSFSKLQSRMHMKCSEKALDKKVRITFFVFDILQYQGWDLRKVPLIERKAILKQGISFNSRIKYTTHKLASGKKFFQIAKTKNWEGIVGKKIDSEYVSRRSRSWLKFKCCNRQEMIICGFTKPAGSRLGFGALLLGYYYKGSLRFGGKVGTGFNQELLNSLTGKLKKILRETSPFQCQKVPSKNVSWVDPKYVAEIEFTEWTKDGKLRHPSFLGLRNDKTPKSVKKEL